MGTSQAFVGQPRHVFTFEGGPRDGEKLTHEPGTRMISAACAQQPWQGSVWCYVHEQTLRLVWTEVPKNLINLKSHG